MGEVLGQAEVGKAGQAAGEVNDRAGSGDGGATERDQDVVGNDVELRSRVQMRGVDAVVRRVDEREPVARIVDPRAVDFIACGVEKGDAPRRALFTSTVHTEGEGWLRRRCGGEGGAGWSGGGDRRLSMCGRCGRVLRRDGGRNLLRRYLRRVERGGRGLADG